MNSTRKPYTRFDHDRLKRFEPIITTAVSGPEGSALFVELHNITARSASVYLHDYIRGFVMHDWPAPEGFEREHVVLHFRANIISEHDKQLIYIGPRNKVFTSEQRMGFDYAPIKRANIITQVLKPGTFHGPPEITFDPQVVAALCLLRERGVLTQVFKVSTWSLNAAEKFLTPYPSLVAIEDDNFIAII